ncbi:MAG TPA: tetratricopeptide repeat protein [Terracidiphilus sp.]|nr:tetratricopeptide repeat protein [Terracidiphilus sp.]
MKRQLSLWMGLPAAAALLAFAMMPAFAQQTSTAPAAGEAAAMGKIHGHVTNPTGEPQGNGEIGLSTDGGATLKYKFPVDASGDYSGQAPAGTYMVIYREPDTPPGKMVDFLRGVKVVAGQDVAADIDMSRQAYIDQMTPDQKKQLEELKKQNASAIEANKVINNLNADLRTVNQDIKDADAAHATAVQQLGASATPAAVAAKVAEIQNAKYTDVETLMTKDTSVKPDQGVLWAELGRGQLGLKKYDAAIASFQKAVTLEKAEKKPAPDIIGLCESGMGEAYARSGKVTEANTAFDAAAKDDPTRANMYLRNQAVIFFQEHNLAAQVTAADEAIKTDPNDAILYYIKGQGLVANATVDPKTQRIVLPPDCTDAYQKYLELDPDGPFSTEVKGILSAAGEKISSNYRASKKH